MHIRCPHCHNAIEVVEDSSFRDVSCPSCGSHFNLVGGDAPTAAGPAKPRRVGHFELIEQLGVGNFGTVWKAKDTTLDRFVAVKIPRSDQLDEADVEKFFREARAAAQLRHSNIVAVHEVGRDGHTIFIASDYVEGATLKEWLRGQPLPPREAAELCAKIADALHSAHEAGVVHRDLKSGNIMMDMDGEPHIMDFGLAKRESGEITMTIDGALLGTPAYMPPEQAAGKGHEADRRSDVYSLGVILFEMLTGELPFRGEKRMLIVQILRDEPASPRKLNGQVPRDLETICLKCLEKSPDKRYPSAGELSDELKRFLDGEPIKAHPVGTLARGWRGVKRNPAVAVLIALLLVIAIVGPAIAIRQAMLRRDLEETVKARIDAQTVSLLNADIQAVPVILKDLVTDLDSVIPQLKQLQANGELTDDQRLRIRLALVQSDESIALELADQLLTAHLLNVPVITTALQPHAGKISETLWQVLHDKSQSDERRFRAVLALASLDAESSFWSEADNEFIVRQLVAANPEHQPSLRNMLLKRSAYITDSIERVFVDDRSEENQRLAASRALAFFVGNNGLRLARLACLATPRQYEILFPQLAQSCDQATKNILDVLVAEQPTNELTVAQRVALGKQRAGAGISLLRLGEIETSHRAFHITDDPESLTQFVHRCKDRGVTANEILASLHAATDVRSRFALLLTLGDYPLAEVEPAQRDALIQELIAEYRSDPSSAIHGASGWLLRRWGFEREVTNVDHTPLPYDPTGIREWYVLEVCPKRSDVAAMQSKALGDATSVEQKIHFTFIVFPPGEFQMGSSEGESGHEGDERLHPVKLTRRFAVSAQEISWLQYDPLDGGQMHAAVERTYAKKVWPTDPAFRVNWLEAVRYCRWLSVQAGLLESEQCYDENRPLLDSADGDAVQWSTHFDRRGFRLLTESEWEYVCRCGMKTAYSFGSDSELLAHYAKFGDNSERWMNRPGQLRPNFRGLSDIHGNLYEWCHDWYSADLPNDVADPLGAESGSARVVRGGSWIYSASSCQSARRGRYVPEDHNSNLGFRVVTTIPLLTPARETNCDSR